jgi:uncharacterized protein YbjT (DUF2867 family)
VRRVAVIGATGTAGRRATDKLRSRDVTPVEISRSKGVDLHTGAGLREALTDVEIVIDASNARFPEDDSTSIGEALTTATRNVVEACARQQVTHLVLLSISGIHNRVFDDFPYYVAKRDQENIVSKSSVPSTIVESTQWYEFATNPTAVTFRNDHVVVQDWLIQPIAADTVADVLVEAALDAPSTCPRVIAGPDVIRLPDLTTKLLARRGEQRPVRVVAPPLAALAEGALLAPDNATMLGPDLDTWLETIDRTSVPNTVTGNERLQDRLWKTS